MKGDNLLDQFCDAIQEPKSPLDVKQSHMALLEDLNKRMKVQKLHSTEENVILLDQDMAEVQNCLGHRTPDETSLIVTEQLLVVNAKTEHLTDVMLSINKNVMV